MARDVPDAVRRLPPVVRVAPAKLNLTLAVVGPRADGYHDLHMVVMPLALADRLSVAVQPAALRDSLHVTGADTGPPDGNLVLRAIDATRRAAAPLAGGLDRLPPLAARLEKQIPVAAGLGGGSSDAAAAIDAAIEAWGVGLDPAARARVAVSVGSDVPLFLAGGAAVVEGRGERVTPLRPLTGNPPGVLLVTPAMPVSTADVFALFRAAGSASGSTRLSSEHLAEELRRGLSSVDLVTRAGVLASANDLIGPTTLLAPQLVALRRALMRHLGRPVGQTGSGPTLWALYPSGDDAVAAAELLRKAVAAGELPAPGDAPPAIHATTIVAAASTSIVTTSMTTNRMTRTSTHGRSA